MGLHHTEDAVVFALAIRQIHRETWFSFSCEIYAQFLSDLLRSNPQGLLSQ